MRCWVPPGDSSQLTTTIGASFPPHPGEQGGNSLTEPRAHSRIHRIAKPVVCACLFTTSGSVVCWSSHTASKET
ncbi:hypothetical protein DN602_22355 [Raoultella ornithinolytica]|nr:hypothetical protein DN602_22355 [Raoultella ornithinolytica]